MQAALSFSLRALRIMSLKSKLNETTQSACKLIGRYVWHYGIIVDSSYMQHFFKHVVQVARGCGKAQHRRGTKAIRSNSRQNLYI